MEHPTRACGKPLREDHRAEVTELIRTAGEQQAAELLDVSRHTLGRLVGGLRVQRGTAALVAQRLSAIRGDEVRRAAR